VFIAIGITATLDAHGLTAFSALPLLPLLALFAFVERLPLRTLGFVWGRARGYALAVAYPVIVIGIVSIAAFLAGGAHLDRAHIQKAALDFIMIAVATAIVAPLTEEGFFRGWLWASLSKRGAGTSAMLISTSLAFALWHVSYATLAKGYTLPPLQVIVFIANAAVIGAIWGLMRAVSGSIVVSSVSHALWNGAAYAFFGEGPKSGPLGLPNTIIWGPEIGVVGLTANVVCFAALYWWLHREHVLREENLRDVVNDGVRNAGTR
jgi:membrane protease YdiL (CAAX protease family)